MPLEFAQICRTDLPNARVYKNGLVVVWKGDRPGQTRDILTRAAKKKRTFSVKRTRLQSACVAAWCAKRTNVMLFLAFTFPFDVNEADAAKIWELTLDTLRKLFNVKVYTWVKERQKTGRLHYHIIIDRSRIDILKLQRAYNSAITTVTGRTDVSNNSVRLGFNPIIRSVEAISRYLSKYISKSDNLFSKRAAGWSDLSLYDDMTTPELLILLQKKQITSTTIEVSECFSIYFLHDYPQKMYSG